MSELPFFTSNVFTDRIFAGNPLAIVLDADGLETPQMQTLAREFNLPETIFVQTPADSENTAKVRIFFPTDEIPFAGHPTIGCAIFLAEQEFPGNGDFETRIVLEEVAGIVPVRVSRKNGKVNAQFTAPVIPSPRMETPPSKEQAAQALGLDPAEIGGRNHGIASHQGGPSFLFIPVNSREALAKCRACEPFCSGITHESGATGAYVYFLGEDIIHARMFAPAAGIPEDPATGSATALLASQLKTAGELKNGANRFSLQQGYDMGRPSDLDLEIDFDGSKISAVRVAGSSVRVSRGHVTVPPV